MQSHIEKGKTYFWKEGFTTEKAIECFNQAIALNPESSIEDDIDIVYDAFLNEPEPKSSDVLN